MKKEVRAYYKSVMSSRNFRIDLVNLILGVLILALTVFVFTIENMLFLFPLIFFLGAVMTTLNAIKTIKRNKLFGIFFMAFGIILLAAALFGGLIILGVL